MNRNIIHEKPIRVLNLFTIMDRGGAETMVMNYYRNINRDKVQFDFIVHRDQRGAYDDEIERLGGHIYRFCPIRPWKMKQYKAMITSFFDSHPNYYIIHSHMSEMGVYILQEAKNRGVPVRICHAHNAQVGWDYKTPLRYYYKRLIATETTHRFVCSEKAGIWLFGKAYVDEFIFMSNAIRTSSFRYNKDTRDRVRTELGIQDKIVIGHVGRFNTQKNHPFVVKVFSSIHRFSPDTVLILIGDGEEKNRIKRQVEHLGLKKSVVFLGSRGDVNDLLQAMDAFLFPSKYEGLSLALIEAQTTGLPCVVSDSISSESFLTENVNPLSLQLSCDEWANTIISVLNSKTRTDCADTIIQKGFDIESNVKWLEDFYLNVVSHYDNENEISH